LQGLLSAWHGPQGALISNDEAATFVARAPERLVGVAGTLVCLGRWLHRVPT
jgi:hypothetical protein